MWVLCGQFKEPLQSLGRPKFHLRQHCSIHTYMHSAGDRRQGQNMWLGRWYVKGILLKYPMLEPVLKLTWMTVAPCVSEKMSDPDIWQGDCRHNAHLLPSFHHLPSSHCKQPPLWLPHQVQVKSGKSSLRVWLFCSQVWGGLWRWRKISSWWKWTLLLLRQPSPLLSWPGCWCPTSKHGNLRAVTKKNYPRANKGSFRWEGQEYSQRPVYRGPASSVLYFSEQPTYSCWMVGKRHWLDKSS